MDSAGFKYKGGNVLVRMSSYGRVMSTLRSAPRKKRARFLFSSSIQENAPMSGLAFSRTLVNQNLPARDLSATFR